VDGSRSVALRSHLKQRTGLSSIERMGVVAAASAVAHPLLLVATRLAVRTGPVVESIGVKAVAGEFSSIARTAGLRGFAPGLPLSLLLSVGTDMCLPDKTLAWPWLAVALSLTVVQRHLMVQGVDGMPQRYRNSSRRRRHRAERRSWRARSRRRPVPSAQRTV
jgi:hypothetical protein